MPADVDFCFFLGGGVRASCFCVIGITYLLNIVPLNFGDKLISLISVKTFGLGQMSMSVKLLKLLYVSK